MRSSTASLIYYERGSPPMYSKCDTFSSIYLNVNRLRYNRCEAVRAFVFIVDSTGRVMTRRAIHVTICLDVIGA
jgi:hypothetical protein